MSKHELIDDATLSFLSSLRVLCIDDSKTTQFLYQTFLEDIVHEVLVAENGQVGYDTLMSNKVDIVFTDYDMPICNGLEFIEKVREENQEIPILLVSAIEDVDVIGKALNLSVSYFMKKPIDQVMVLNELVKASKILMANNYLQEQKKKNEYNSYQEDLAFAKELNILRNDFYYQMKGDKHISLVDFLYHPLDVVSGDAYTARRIDEYRAFYLIVDGMGKGLSASLSAMIITSFINHLIDKMIEYDSFCLDMLVKESIAYIQPVLLDEEALAIDFILFDDHYEKLSYAKFAMPVVLLEDLSGNVTKLKSNNPPLSKWQADFKVDEYDISKYRKFLFYSDGIAENTITEENSTYADYIESDFKASFTREELKDRIYSKISDQEDDFTMVFIHKLKYRDSFIAEKNFSSSLQSLDEADEWYSNIWSKLSQDSQLVSRAAVVFSELIMNAYEHGNLGISASAKHKLLEEDTYFDTLKEKELGCDKTIVIKVDKITNATSNYVITQIIDEGKGFDTQILSTIFRNSKAYNGRGVFVSRKNSMGIYYNTKGNSVLFLNKI